VVQTTIVVCLTPFHRQNIAIYFRPQLPARRSANCEDKEYNTLHVVTNKNNLRDTGAQGRDDVTLKNLTRFFDKQHAGRDRPDVIRVLRSTSCGTPDNPFSLQLASRLARVHRSFLSSRSSALSSRIILGPPLMKAGTITLSDGHKVSALPSIEKVDS